MVTVVEELVLHRREDKCRASDGVKQSAARPGSEIELMTARDGEFVRTLSEVAKVEVTAFVAE